MAAAFAYPDTSTGNQNLTYLTDYTMPSTYWQEYPATMLWRTVALTEPVMSPGALAAIALAGIPRPLVPEPSRPVLAVRTRHTLAPRTLQHARRRRRRWSVRARG